VWTWRHIRLHTRPPLVQCQSMQPQPQLHARLQACQYHGSMRHLRQSPTHQQQWLQRPVQVAPQISGAAVSLSLRLSTRRHQLQRLMQAALQRSLAAVSLSLQLSTLGHQLQPLMQAAPQRSEAAVSLSLQQSTRQHQPCRGSPMLQGQSRLGVAEASRCRHVAVVQPWWQAAASR